MAWVNPFDIPGTELMWNSDGAGTWLPASASGGIVAEINNRVVVTGAPVGGNGAGPYDLFAIRVPGLEAFVPVRVTVEAIDVPADAFGAQATVQVGTDVTADGTPPSPSDPLTIANGAAFAPVGLSDISPNPATLVAPTGGASGDWQVAGLGASYVGT